jgi:hypothetical protein
VARAKQAAVEHSIPAWGDDAELYADDTVDILVNLPVRIEAGPEVVLEAVSERILGLLEKAGRDPRRGGAQ